MVLGVLGLMGGDVARKGASAANKQAEGYTLPYIFKDGSMDGTNKLSPEDLAAMKQLVAQAKQSIKKNA